MTTPEQHREYADAYAGDAQRATETLADELTRLAEDLRIYASGFDRSVSGVDRGSPSGLAADIVSKFINGNGLASTRLWSVVHNAGKAEKYLADAAPRPTSDQQT